MVVTAGRARHLEALLQLDLAAHVAELQGCGAQVVVCQGGQPALVQPLTGRECCPQLLDAVLLLVEDDEKAAEVEPGQGFTVTARMSARERYCPQRGGPGRLRPLGQPLLPRKGD